MTPASLIQEFPFSPCLDDEVREQLEQFTTIRELAPGETLARQFAIGERIYFLVEGEVSISIPLYESGKSYNVGLIKERLAPIGWSAFRHPCRYATSFVATKSSRLISWPIDALQQVLNDHCEFAAQFLSFIYRQSLPVLTNIQNLTRPYFANESLAFEETRPLLAPEHQKQTLKDSIALLNQSAFCDSFTQAEIHSLAKVANIILAHQGDIISQQSKPEDGLYLLVKGKAVVSYQTEAGDIITTRSISRSGTVLASCTLDNEQKNRASIISSRDSTILFIGKADLVQLAEENPKLGIKYWHRLIWLIGTHLLAARMRYLSQVANDEVLAVNNVIEQNAAVLPVSSPLYKVGKLLANAVTTDEAFGVLYQCLHYGERIERTIAGMCLDILKDLQRENAFYRHLKRIYDDINALPADLGANDVRRIGTERFQQAFQQVPYVIKGLENLPKKAGSLFIYNHLLGSQSTQLPNGFRYSLDAQFISSMIIAKNYGMPGQRVVRRSREYEYWRDAFYARFGNIFVDSWQSLVSGSEQHEQFLRDGQDTLKRNIPLLISPEGRSFSTLESPGELLPYVFELAQSMAGEDEPWIVPIAVANFDKRADHNIYSIVIRPAFRISDRLAEYTPDAMAEFLKQYQEEFRDAVAEAEALAQEIKQYPILSGRRGFESNVLSVNQIDVEFESDVRELEFRLAHHRDNAQSVAFYGSSTMRLWPNFEQTFGPLGGLNLGFSGATIEACVYYFERIVLPRKPRSLVLYAGDSDIGNNHDANKVIANYIQLLEKVDIHLPGIPVTLISIKSSPTRERLRNTIEMTNKQLQQLARTRPNTRYIDLFTLLKSKDGSLDETYFENDMLHINSKGYRRWNDALMDHKEFIFNAK
jgi:CRP-like cAMP-binding protein/lysophospholipase L1-like esterase